jgi:hypothetical protein
MNDEDDDTYVLREAMPYIGAFSILTFLFFFLFDI